MVLCVPHFIRLLLLLLCARNFIFTFSVRLRVAVAAVVVFVVQFAILCFPFSNDYSSSTWTFQISFRCFTFAFCSFRLLMFRYYCISVVLTLVSHFFILRVLLQRWKIWYIFYCIEREYCSAVFWWIDSLDCVSSISFSFSFVQYFVDFRKTMSRPSQKEISCKEKERKRTLKNKLS